MYGVIEMRKLNLAFLISLMTVPAMADNWIKFKAQAVEDTINTLVAQENRVAAKNEYEKQMDQTTGKISVMGIYKVCAAAGKDIRTNDGYSQCRYFINQIAEKSGFGTKSANQANCASKFNGVWTLSADSKQYQCVGKDGYKLVYKKSCESEDANSKCIKDFSGLKTTGPVGREFIVEYGNKKNLKLTCYTGFETRRSLTSPFGQDYIRCSAGGKSYEFEFDSLNQDPGKTSVESENKAMCEFFGGKIVKHPDSYIEKIWQSCDISKDLCKGKLHSLALRIGHTTMYQGYCRLSREAKSTDYANLHTIKGVDSKIFYNSGAQMRSDMAKVQLEEYLHNTFPNESYIVCDPTAKEFNYGLGIDSDYVMTCTVGSQQVDFLFHDLTEGRKSRADTGMDAMQCIISGGTFKGESCRGPTKAECDKLDAALRAKGSTEGAKWDDKVRACILGNAMKTYKQDVATNYIVGAVVIVGGTLVVIGTGGLTAPVVVGGVEMLVGDLAINYAIDANHRRLSKQAANRFGSFINEAEKCNSEQCALKILEKHYATLSGVWNDLNTDDQTIVNSTIDKLIGLIKTEYVACGKNEAGQTVYAAPADCAMQSSTLRAIDYIDKASEPVLIIGSIVYNPGFVTTRFVRMKNISKVAKTAVKNSQTSLIEIENMYQQKLSDDVLDLQKSEGMAQKVEKYNDALKRAKESLSPEEYKAFERMVEYETYIQEQEYYIQQVESNLRNHNYSESTIDTYLADKVSEVRNARTQLDKLYETHPQAADFMDRNYFAITDPNSIILESDDAVIQKKVDMTAEISKHVDDAALTNNVLRFKEDIIANFPKEMYQKAKNWNQLSGPDKANFVAYELIPYLQKQQGLAQIKIEVQLLPASHIGGNASFCDGTKCIAVSVESLNNASFELMLEELSHETIHAGQYIDGGRSLLSKDIIAVSDANYVAALRNLDANRANAVEREAYKTTGMFKNILNEIAQYHNW